MHITLFGYNLYPFLVILMGSLFLTVGDIVAKAWVQHSRPLHFAITLGLYMVGLICLVLSFRYKNIAVASMILIGLNVLILAIWSWLVYGETLNRVEITGLILGFIAVCLLEFGGQDLN